MKKSSKNKKETKECINEKIKKSRQEYSINETTNDGRYKRKVEERQVERIYKRNVKTKQCKKKRKEGVRFWFEHFHSFLFLETRIYRIKVKKAFFLRSPNSSMYFRETSSEALEYT